MTVTTTSAHGLQNGNKIKLEDDSFTFICIMDQETKHILDLLTHSQEEISIFNVTTNIFDIQTLDVVPSQTQQLTFVSATSTAVQKKRMLKL